MTFTHVHDPRYLEPPEPDEPDEDGPFSLDPEAASAAASFVSSCRPFTVESFPYVTPLSEIPAALGGNQAGLVA